MFTASTSGSTSTAFSAREPATSSGNVTPRPETFPPPQGVRRSQFQVEAQDDDDLNQRERIIQNPQTQREGIMGGGLRARLIMFNHHHCFRASSNAKSPTVVPKTIERWAAERLLEQIAKQNDAESIVVRGQ